MTNGKSLGEFESYVGFWIYGPKKDFPNASTKGLPKEVKDLGFVRIGFSGSMIGVNLHSRGDFLIEIGRKAYLGKKVSVMDYMNLEFKHTLNKEGILLCEHTSMRQLNGQPSKTESNVQPQQSHSDGETTETDDTTKVYA